MSHPRVPTLDEIVAAARAHPGLRAKHPIALVAEIFGGTDWAAGPGDDGAIVEFDAAGAGSGPPDPTVDRNRLRGDGIDGREHSGDRDRSHPMVVPAAVVVGGEAMLPAFVQADPFAAGVAAMLTNVNDLAAMGAEPLALVDTIVGPEDVARRALEGLRRASALYDVPVVGGHLTIHHGPPALSAFGVGRATPGRALSVTRAAPGQRLLLAGCVEGAMRADFPFFGSFDQRGSELAGDVRLLAGLAREGVAVAAKDVSMAGILGSLGMLLEHGGLGVTVDLDALPRPAGVGLIDWLGCFPCVVFLVCAARGRESECARRFHDRGLAAEVIGTLDDSGRLRVSAGGATATVLDVRTEPVTGLRRGAPPPPAGGAGPPAP
ncbi:MAG TPA: AIR synthase related protein [Acidimicrobiia bacterium]|nr:AIR synthase related protein [Acidimicrobiia bacterium]